MTCIGDIQGGGPLPGIIRVFSLCLGNYVTNKYILYISGKTFLQRFCANLLQLRNHKLKIVVLVITGPMYI